MFGLFGKRSQAKQPADGGVHGAGVSDARASVMEALNTLLDMDVCGSGAQGRALLQERFDEISVTSATFPELVAPAYCEFAQIALAVTVIKAQLLKAHGMAADQDVVQAAVADMRRQALLAVHKLA
mmetsp:Transcript_48764/g.137845  ORF Transcript_48764/g.137845 Transcript_48764/m.137845 type:complete len:126 (+) Transcript_48764:78-455(+)